MTDGIEDFLDWIATAVGESSLSESDLSEEEEMADCLHEAADYLESHTWEEAVDTTFGRDDPSDRSIDGELKFAEEYVDALLSGEKTATVRYDKEWGPYLGETIAAVTPDGDHIATIEITDVVKTDAHSALDIIASCGKSHNAGTPSALLTALNEHYDDTINGTTEVTVYGFEVVETDD